MAEVANKTGEIVMLEIVELKIIVQIHNETNIGLCCVVFSGGGENDVILE